MLSKKIVAPFTFTSGQKENHCSIGSGFLVRIDNFNDVQVCDWAWNLFAVLLALSFFQDTFVAIADFILIIAYNQLCMGKVVVSLHIVGDAHNLHRING